MRVYEKCKVYNDGSHYIAIPYIPNLNATGNKPQVEEVIAVQDDMNIEENEPNSNEEVDVLTEIEDIEKIMDKEKKSIKKRERYMTRREIFEELYEQNIELKKEARKRAIVKAMLPYFDSDNAAEFYVTVQFERKERNLICRRVRLTRKVFLANFNYFCTFTYDNEKHTEESFKNKLRGCFKMMCHRKGWKYVGVWERSPINKRLHFHGLFNIPEGKMPGELITVKDYDTKKRKVQETIQNTYFNDRFGRSDFKEINGTPKLGSAIVYLCKYMEKTGEKIVYSKGLPQYFISDIVEDDVVCRMGIEDKKLLLFDDFSCINDGEYIGKVSEEVIEQMPKSN